MRRRTQRAEHATPAPLLQSRRFNGRIHPSPRANPPSLIATWRAPLWRAPSTHKEPPIMHTVKTTIVTNATGEITGYGFCIEAEHTGSEEEISGAILASLE